MDETKPATQVNVPIPPGNGIEFRKLDVSVRETDYSAGKSNLTAIVIRNTYPVSIKLLSVSARHSSLSNTDKGTYFRASTKRTVRPSNTRVNIRVYNLIPDFLRIFSDKDRKRLPIFELRHQASSVSDSEPLYVTAEQGSRIVIDESQASDREVYITAEQGAEVTVRESQQGGGRRAIGMPEISSMSEIVSEYVWKTNHWLLFTPLRTGIDIEVRYQIGSEIRSQVVSTFFDIKPPIQSVVLGSIAGGILGSVSRSLTENYSIDLTKEFVVRIVASCLLSIIASVSLSRKSGSQSFITVEDFFGAFVLGSLIGYQGTSFFEKTVIDTKGIEEGGKR